MSAFSFRSRSSWVQVSLLSSTILEAPLRLVSPNLHELKLRLWRIQFTRRSCIFVSTVWNRMRELRNFVSSWWFYQSYRMVGKNFFCTKNYSLPFGLPGDHGVISRSWATQLPCACLRRTWSSSAGVPDTRAIMSNSIVPQWVFACYSRHNRTGRLQLAVGQQQTQCA